MLCCSHKLSSIRNICRYTQPPVGRKRLAPRSHNHRTHNDPSDISLVS
ncbi:Serine/threonine-protein kinase ppk24, mitochondrial [Gossypium arboreum]|uniref:Serine/threonine-protein kinase ppk24, mitochondrial n=1 Tax=Gossypium arboreum TaxID=29729 RepID=A0A0B0PW15_GOSAR|nr:Serine/threonine-protein kinase ppk24, mitochondrial [Gossypium arboreum]